MFSRCMLVSARAGHHRRPCVLKVNVLKHFRFIFQAPLYSGAASVSISKRFIHSTRKLEVNESKSPLVNSVLTVAIYGSFAVGFFLLSAVGFREYKRYKRRQKGFKSLNIKEWGRLQMFEYNGYVLPEFVVNQLEDVNKFETRSNDVWVVSFPRSGTTWLQEIVYLIQSNMDIDHARKALLDDRFPYLEFTYPGVKIIQESLSPRRIKTHLPYSLLPESVKKEKPKIIYIARNPKDTVVSFYHYVRYLFPVTRYKGEFEEFFNLFVNDQVFYSPWSKHVQEFWERRNEDNILFLTYEDLKKDTAGTIDKIAAFLGKTVTPEDKKTIISHCSFENMRRNPTTNHYWFETLGIADPKQGTFMRKGCIGDWSNYFTAYMDRTMEDMIYSKFQNSDIAFSFSGTHVPRDNEES